MVVHQNTLDHIPVRKPEQILARAVDLRDLNSNCFRHRQLSRLREALPEILRQIAHLIKCGSLLSVYPGKELRCAEFLLPRRRQVLRKLLPCHGTDVRFLHPAS